jgi:histidinol phosphatase-like enzyme
MFNKQIFDFLLKKYIYKYKILIELNKLNGLKTTDIKTTTFNKATKKIYSIIIINGKKFTIILDIREINSRIRLIKK